MVESVLLSLFIMFNVEAHALPCTQPSLSYCFRCQTTYHRQQCIIKDPTKTSRLETDSTAGCSFFIAFIEKHVHVVNKIPAHFQFFVLSDHNEPCAKVMAYCHLVIILVDVNERFKKRPATNILLLVGRLNIISYC